MKNSYTQLSPAEIERLVLLAEEAGEVVQAVGKILRRGFDQKHPRKPEGPTNRAHLEEELGNLGSAVAMLTKAGDLDMDKIIAAEDEKRATVGQYLYQQG